MYSLNRATVLGNATRDPEVRQIASGQSVCSFGVATNRSWTDAAGVKQEAAEFHNIVAWGKLAEICGQYLAKGRKVYVEGRMQTREWQAKDGNKRQTMEIVAENIILLDRPTGGAPRAAGTPTFAPSASKKSVVMDEPAAASEEEIKIEDIPF